METASVIDWSKERGDIDCKGVQEALGMMEMFYILVVETMFTWVYTFVKSTA